jgi:hypothetical protein
MLMLPKSQTEGIKAFAFPCQQNTDVAAKRPGRRRERRVFYVINIIIFYESSGTLWPVRGSTAVMKRVMTIVNRRPTRSWQR